MRHRDPGRARAVANPEEIVVDRSPGGDGCNPIAVLPKLNVPRTAPPWLPLLVRKPIPPIMDGGEILSFLFSGKTYPKPSRSPEPMAGLEMGIGAITNSPLFSFFSFLPEPSGGACSTLPGSRSSSRFQLPSHQLRARLVPGSSAGRCSRSSNCKSREWQEEQTARRPNLPANVGAVRALVDPGHFASGLAESGKLGFLYTDESRVNLGHVIRGESLCP